MEARKFLSSTLPFRNPQVSWSSLSMRRIKPRKPFFIFNATSGRSGSARNYGGDYRGSIVDENMIVLRMRIQEIKMLERRNETPSNWMDWEKKYYANNGYNEDLCEALGFLQNYLMNMRPGLALGLIALVTLSLVISTGVVLFHAIQIAHIIISSIWVLSVGLIFLFF
ncbi:hypothetical protein Ddye_012230 [Dipteronia dyeriana]|uniref:Uncharacterized protein n=1 Tax=Dipteronia dyeriana TaxID=168575 RepID=A0AAE0CID6_9ROSI|nr:hypothetical protein Ddye_012230 [Dipteronia dyeriana]